MNKATTALGDRPSIDHRGMRHIVRVFAAIVLIGMLLFTSAGRLDWKEGWIYVGGWPPSRCCSSP